MFAPLPPLRLELQQLGPVEHDLASPHSPLSSAVMRQLSCCRVPTQLRSKVLISKNRGGECGDGVTMQTVSCLVSCVGQLVSIVPSSARLASTHWPPIQDEALTSKLLHSTKGVCQLILPTAREAITCDRQFHSIIHYQEKELYTTLN